MFAGTLGQSCTSTTFAALVSSPDHIFPTQNESFSCRFSESDPFHVTIGLISFILKKKPVDGNFLLAAGDYMRRGIWDGVLTLQT